MEVKALLELRLKTKYLSQTSCSVELGIKSSWKDTITLSKLIILGTWHFNIFRKRIMKTKYELRM